MNRWEYASIMSEGPATRDVLNDLGDQGWELISFLQGKDTGQILYVFKRPKANEPSAASNVTLLA